MLRGRSPGRRWPKDGGTGIATNGSLKEEKKTAGMGGKEIPPRLRKGGDVRPSKKKGVPAG